MSGVTEQHWDKLVDEAIGESFEQIRDVRRHLHQYPETSGNEYETSRYLMSVLDEAELKPRYGPDRRGLILDGGDASGPRIVLRGDIDALPIHDEKQTEYCSRIPGAMHACGHDAHAAIVFGACLALSELEREGKFPWPVRWRGLFQPAEETCRGALEMVESGVLTGVGAILGVHMDPSRRVGTIGVRVGELTAECHEVELEVIGRGAHAARPHESVDPIATTAQLISAIYLFVPRSIDSQDPVVISFGQIAGGHSSNVIPEKVIVRGTLRTLNREVSEATMKHVERLARGVAEASETTIRVRWNDGPPSVKNDANLTNLLRQAGVAVVGADHVQTIPRPSMGGEDFANYLPHVPGAMFRLGCSRDLRGAPPLHSPLFDLDEDSLRIGARILARAAISWNQPSRPSNR